MTFQELIDNVGIDTVFANTSADLATQNCILEWFFDYDLCDSDDTTKWMRVFRRRVNDVYPKYLSLVRIMTVKDNMDPFIQVFMEKIHSTTDLKNTTLTIRDSGTNSQEDTRQTVTDRDVDQFDTRSKTDTYNNLTDTHNRGANGIKSETTYNNYNEVTNGGSSGNNTDTTSGDPYNTTNAIESTGESRAIGVAYPEANMGSIPNGVASDAGATSDIAYAQSESRNFSKSNTGATRADQHLDQTVESEYSDTNNSTKTISGSHAVTETGTDSNVRTGSVQTLNGGKLETNEDITVDDTLTRSGTHNYTKSHTGQSNDSNKLEIAEQGRTESPADILPRAVRAIIGSDEIQFLIDGLMPCFDCFGRL